MLAPVFKLPARHRKKTILNDIELEEVIEKTERVPAHLALKTAQSLKPGIQMMEAAALGQPEACAIRDAWAFRANRATRVKVVSRAEFAEMVEKGTVTFGA